MRPFAVVLLSALAAEAGEDVRRTVVALYDSAGREEEIAGQDPVHQLLEMPLHYLGMVVRRHDVRRGPPPEEWLEGARAVVTYFEAAKEPPAWLWPWLEKRARLRIVHVGEFGPLEADPPRLKRWLARFRLDWDDGYREGPLGIRVEMNREPFEADARAFTIHRGPRNLSRGNSVWVATHVEDTRAPVVTGPWGGLALDPWLANRGGEHDDRRWHLDPFLFFRDALGLKGVPAPHPQVLNGLRLFFVHIDGDGFESVSTVKANASAARVLKEEVLERFALPFTVSVIVRSLTGDLAVEEPTRAMRLAREIFALRNVEAASHGVLHPQRWDKKSHWYKEIANYDYDTVAEVTESIRFVRKHLAPCRLMLWTGEANPSAAAIRAAPLNLNGGVFRWDARTNSVGFVTPWGRLDGNALQVYAGAANENDFDGFFTTMPGAFAHVSTTIERTGEPRILKPANVYGHFYSAERPARLAALRKLIRRWGMEEETAPVFASFYAAAVHSALTTARIARTPEGWTLRDFGGCRTVRVDDEPRGVDWRRSRGLLGARRVRGSLFLHLAAPDADVVLAPSPRPHPHVEQANHLLTEVVVQEGGVRFCSQSLASRRIVLAGFPPDSDLKPYRADSSGRVCIELPPGGPEVFQIGTR